MSTLKKGQAKCHNLYINEGVQDSRKFHYDERILKFKSFVFLTDVKELEDGPYCHVKKSHRRRCMWWRSELFNKKNQLSPFESNHLQGAEAISLFAKAGDMVLSSQKGANAVIPSVPKQNVLC